MKFLSGVELPMRHCNMAPNSEKVLTSCKKIILIILSLQPELVRTLPIGTNAINAKQSQQ